MPPLRRNNVAHDFAPNVAKLKSKGVIKDTSDIKYPQELEQASLLKVEELGCGAFGLVYKGIFHSKTAEFSVAIKVFSNAICMSF